MVLTGTTREAGGLTGTLFVPGLSPWSMLTNLNLPSGRYVHARNGFEVHPRRTTEHRTPWRWWKSTIDPMLCDGEGTSLIGRTRTASAVLVTSVKARDKAIS